MISYIIQDNGRGLVDPVATVRHPFSSSRGDHHHRSYHYYRHGRPSGLFGALLFSLSNSDKGLRITTTTRGALSITHVILAISNNIDHDDDVAVVKRLSLPKQNVMVSVRE